MPRLALTKNGWLRVTASTSHGAVTLSMDGQTIRIPARKWLMVMRLATEQAIKALPRENPRTRGMTTAVHRATARATTAAMAGRGAVAREALREAGEILDKMAADDLLWRLSR